MDDKSKTAVSSSSIEKRTWNEITSELYYQLRCFPESGELVFLVYKVDAWISSFIAAELRNKS